MMLAESSAVQAVVAAVFGAVAGFLFSIPGGPVNVTILNEGARRGFRWAFFIGLGAVVMESLYCGLAFAGSARVFDSRTIRAAMELVSFLLMLWLGIKYVRGTPMPGEARGIEMVEQQFHPHTAFWTGFVRVLGNPGILLLWLATSAALLSHEWIENSWERKLPFIGGVFFGGLVWFFLLSWGVSRGTGRFSPGTLRRLSRISGIFLLIAAVGVAIRLVLLLRR